MDPGIAKLVSLPFFSSALPDVLISYKLTSVELFLAVQAGSGEDFVGKFTSLAPVLGHSTLQAYLAVLRSQP